MSFEPDYRHFAVCMKNIRPARLPLYEHIIEAASMETILGLSFKKLLNGTSADKHEFFSNYCLFFRDMTYDVVSFESCICEILPGHGALSGGRPGPVQTRADFNRYPWDDIPVLFRERSQPRFDALAASLPPGMKAVGGVGNGVFEISEDLVGLEHLPFMAVDDPELYADLFVRIGDVMLTIWSEFLDRYKDSFVAGRFGDDLGFKSSLLTDPYTVREHIIPQYRRIIDAVHAAGLPFLLHSCGCIFETMDDLIACGIDAKHSNEDAIAPFSRWIDLYADRIGLAGGFDMDFLCRNNPEDITAAVIELGGNYRRQAKGYALGSGNSIPPYIPAENYLAMIEGARKLREMECTL